MDAPQTNYKGPERLSESIAKLWNLNVMELDRINFDEQNQHISTTKAFV